ncbi:hypothetical protein [Terrabacter sp. 2RAF25]|uniref:hypothetical protein n=1 Tax=Terrabacter sp. 2RAF25 TaxID=3232998 RepID=UPI003F9E125B
MCTVLITYSTPPAPPAPGAEPRAEVGAGADGRDTADSTGAASVQLMVAGIDEAIAETIATELARAGHRVTCRPCVATPTTERGFDLVVVVDHLHVTHHSDTVLPQESSAPDGTVPYAAGLTGDDATPRVRELEPDLRAPTPATGEATIPMTWCADFRAVEAWGQSIADHLVRFLELRSEVVRIRSELVRCRALLKAVTPEPRTASAVELGRPVGTGRPLHTGERRVAAGQTRKELR